MYLDPGVRDAAFEALGVVFKSAGEKSLMAFTADMDPIKLAKVRL